MGVSAMRMGKRRRSVAKEAWWRGHVDQQSSGGQSVREYCLQHELAENSFYAWRRELRLRAQEATSPRKTTGFSEVVVTPAPATAPLEVLIGARRIAVLPGFDPQTLWQVVQVLERPAC